ncbi:transporter substrate-binding domain-containing protein [Brachyspira aalborgi]|uniref:Transporter substrate-binding domain-containing protein n=1 Tax=Brachyspira aalborgi TaxID=29522 RepID=A0A5C8DB29_9SPIR|nr:transporter substrate-binding domain-containing protein [Brachyspira aalborgi]TXJ21262.1 transporter substrate-binding domain-containing protein [Brachyspira aalborgi]
MKVFKILVCMIAIILISCGKSENKSDIKNIIKVGTPAKHKLFSQINNNGEIEGYDIDVWEEIGRRLNRKIEWRQIDLTGGFGELELGKLDTLTQQISITPSRMEKYYFAEPYFLSPYKLYVAETNESINKFEDLFGKTLAVTIQEAAVEHLKVLDPSGKIKLETFSPEARSGIPLLVQNGKIDASQDAAIIFEELKNATGAKIKMVGEPLFTEVNSFPFRKDEEGKKLCDEVSKVVVEMREDGTLEKLAIKWFGYNPMEGLDPKAELEKFKNTL